MPSTRSQIAGRGRSTAITSAPQRSSEISGPISAPAPSTTTRCSPRSSQSGLAATARTASAHDGSTIPAATHRSSWRCRSSPAAACPGTAPRGRAAGRRPLDGLRAQLALDGVAAASPMGTSPSPVSNRICAYSDASPASAIESAAARLSSPASTRRRKCTRYACRQLVSDRAPRAPTGSTGCSASATTVRPERRRAARAVGPRAPQHLFISTPPVPRSGAPTARSRPADG